MAFVRRTATASGRGYAIQRLGFALTDARGIPAPRGKNVPQLVTVMSERVVLLTASVWRTVNASMHNAETFNAKTTRTAQAKMKAA